MTIMDEIKSKPTLYKGINYRSRLEARWAVFFDTLNIKFKYEYLDFTLENGIRYLPDFYLPDFDAFAEVKHKFTDAEKEKCKLLCKLTGKNVFLLEGNPDFDILEMYSIYNNKAELITFLFFPRKSKIYYQPSENEILFEFENDYFGIKSGVLAANNAKFEFNT